MCKSIRNCPSSDMFVPVHKASIRKTLDYMTEKKNFIIAPRILYQNNKKLFCGSIGIIRSRRKTKLPIKNNHNIL